MFAFSGANRSRASAFGQASGFIGHWTVQITNSQQVVTARAAAVL